MYCIIIIQERSSARHRGFLRQHSHRGSEQHRLADQVHRHRRALQQQELQQHRPDVVDAGQGGAEAEGVHLQGHPVGGRYSVSWYQPTKQLKHPLQVMPDLFFYRDPEEVEREEAAKEAEVVTVIYIECGLTSHVHCLDCRK